jgi:hypothetical protein
MASPYLDLAIGAAGLTKMSMKYGTGKDMKTTDGRRDNGMGAEESLGDESTDQDRT